MIAPHNDYMKKKILLIVLILAAAMVSSACGKEKERTVGLFDEETEKNGYSMDMETIVEGQNMHLKMHVQGDSLFVDANINGSRVEMIKNQDGYFILQPDLALGYRINEEMFDDTMDVNLLTSMGSSLEGKEFTKGTANVDGEEYEFEEFTKDGVRTKFVYDREDQLRYIIVESNDELMDPQKMKINAFEKKADASKFIIPTGYSIQEWNEIDDWYEDGDENYEDY